MKQREPKTKPIPVRLNRDTRVQLDSAARRLASNRACVIRLAIYQLLPDVEAGRITLKEETR